MDDIVYHRATESDLQALVDLRIKFLLELLGEHSAGEIEELKNSLSIYFSRFIPDNMYICYIAKHNNIGVGIGGMVIREYPGSFKNPSGKMGYILNMYTTPLFRRKGISSAILKKLEEAGRELGITAFELHATKEGEPVYMKGGFLLHEEPTYRKYVNRH